MENKKSTREPEVAKEMQETEQTEPQTAKTIFTWTALEYIQQQRDKKWYTIAGIALAAAVLLTLITGNWSMALAIIVFAAVYEYLQRHHPPKRVEIEITDYGIHVGHMFFPYSNIKAFWILYGNGVKSLNLRVHKRIHSDVVIQLDSQNPAAIREYLVGQIPEWEGKHESLSDVILRLLKL